MNLITFALIAGNIWAAAPAAKSVPFTLDLMSPYYWDMNMVGGNLKTWLADQPAIANKISAAKSSKAFGDMSDLKDALGAKPTPQIMRARIKKADEEQKHRLLERLPGMAPSPFASCRVLEGCPEAPVSFHVPDAGLVNEALEALVRPWILLQRARYRKVVLRSAPDKGDRIARLDLEGLPKAGLEIHVAPAVSGGLNVWLKGKADPAELYRSERQALLAEAR